jgi:outer membrane beta-barrel protein
MDRRTITVGGCLALVLAACAAQAADEGPLVEQVAVRNRLYTVAGRWEVGANAGLAILGRLTDHYNLDGSVAYNFAEWLGLELRGGYALSRHTSLARQIQDDFFANTSITKANDLADLWEMKAHGILGVRFQPIYGKVSLLAELPVHFQLYAWAGGGAGLFERQSLVICPVKAGASACGEYFSERKVSPIVSLALGFRFFLGQRHGLKLEVRDWSFLDSYFVNVDRAASTADNPTAGGIRSPDAGVTHLVMIDLGYAFLF